MSDLLNPISPRNPSQVILDSSSSNNTDGDEQKEENYIEGAEYIPLPSRGVFYTYNRNYWNLEKLRVRQLNYTDEDILTTRSFFEDGSLFNEVLKNTIVDNNGFQANGLVPIDRDTILLWLRSTAFGKDFEIEYICPNKECNLTSSVIWDLSTLEIPTFDEEIYEELKTTGEHKIITPLKEVVVYVTVPTIGKSNDTEKRLEQKKLMHFKEKKDKKEFLGTGALLLVVAGVEVNGKILRKRDEINNHFTKINLPLSDSRYILKEAEKINLKYNTKKTVICPHCNHTREGVEMPIIHPNFFWPST